MFLEDNERLLPIHLRIRPLTLETMKDLVRIGIKTLRFDCWSSWHESEPSPGVYYWPDEIDRAIDLARKADLKVGLSLYRCAPSWLDEGKVEIVYNAGTPNIPPRDPVFDGKTWCAIDPFCTSALEKELEFLERACEHYFVPGEVQCEYGVLYSAERLLPFNLGPCYTEQMCIDVVLARQKIFARYSEELWTAFHPLLGMGASSVDSSTFPNVGNEHSPAIYAAMHEHLPDHSLNRINYSYFGHHASIPSWKDVLPHVKTWVGAEFAVGVVKHAKALNAAEVWGMVMDITCAPRQPLSEEFDAIAEAVEILENERGEAEEIFIRSS